MVKQGQEVFLRLDGVEPGKDLFSALVVMVQGRVVNLTMSEAFPQPPQEGQDATLFFHDSGEFMQQPARIVEVPADGEGMLVSLEGIGEVVSAESRKLFRVNTMAADFFVQIDGEAEPCRVADVSSFGMGVVVLGSYKLGDVVAMSFTAFGKEYSGEARVQSVRGANRRKRIGLMPLKGPAAKELGEGLQKLAMDMQRAQLRRRAGAA